MAKNRRWFNWILMAGALLVPALAEAQIEANLGNYTGPNAKGYLAPLNEGLSATLQSGMFRSAAVPKSGFHIRFEIPAAVLKFEDADRTFMAQTEEGFFPASEVEAPTVVGSTDAAYLQGQGGAQAVFPGGIDLNSLGLACPQLTIGSYVGTQAIFRFASADFGDADIGDLKFIGVGGRHSISQYFKSPVDIAAHVMWQSLKIGDKLVDASALSYGAQVSKAFGVVEPYGGISYDTLKTKIEYDYTGTPPSTIKVDLEDVNNVHLTIGVGFNLAFAHLYGEIGSVDRTVYAVGLSLGN